jgi:hypothetical protein
VVDEEVGWLDEVVVDADEDEVIERCCPINHGYPS